MSDDPLLLGPGDRWSETQARGTSDTRPSDASTSTRSAVPPPKARTRYQPHRQSRATEKPRRHPSPSAIGSKAGRRGRQDRENRDAKAGALNCAKAGRSVVLPGTFFSFLPRQRQQSPREPWTT